VKAPLRVPLGGLTPGLRELSREAATYATRVHRLGAGAKLVLFDPDAAVEADAELVEISRRGVTVTVHETRAARCTPARSVTLLQGVCKGDKLDAIVRDATELGATRVVPVLCERSVTKPDAARAARWRRIAVEAARQCGRGDAPTIAAPTRFGDAVRAAGKDMLSVCLDPASDRPLGAALAPLAREVAGAPRRGVVVAIGPEGGLTEAELTTATAAGFACATLGPIVLRTETACAAILGALLVASPADPPAG
jgi:16S rRNA (uracil1498-N3)-methyltransferase